MVENSAQSLLKTTTPLSQKSGDVLGFLERIYTENRDFYRFYFDAHNFTLSGVPDHEHENNQKIPSRCQQTA